MLLAAGWIALVFYLTQTPGFSSEHTGKRISGALGASYHEEAVRDVNLAVRKGAHVVLFGLGAVLLKVALSAAPRPYVWAWIGATCCGIADEFHQSFVPGRGASVGDALLDSFGALVGLSALYVWADRRRKRNKHTKAT